MFMRQIIPPQTHAISCAGSQPLKYSFETYTLFLFDGAQ